MEEPLDLKGGTQAVKERTKQMPCLYWKWRLSSKPLQWSALSASKMRMSSTAMWPVLSLSATPSTTTCKRFIPKCQNGILDGPWRQHWIYKHPMMTWNNDLVGLWGKVVISDCQWRQRQDELLCTSPVSCVGKNLHFRQSKRDNTWLGDTDWTLQY